MRAKLITNLKEAGNLPLGRLPSRLEPTSVLMCDPLNFEVKDAKNAFMEGNIGAVDHGRARAEWDKLKQTFEQLGYPVRVIPSQPGVEDMVFAANQVLPGVDDGGLPYVLLSEMVHPSRRKEVPHFEQWFRSAGYRILRLSDSPDSAPRFEGQGDAIWHPGKRLLWGGYGYRTQEHAYDHISRLLDVPVVKLKLVNPKFYHLDTAFAVLDEKSVLFYPAAFNHDGLELIRHYFPNRVEVSELDAGNFACNALCLGRNVVLQRGSGETCARLKELGFNPVEVETGEFMKSGGSVFCLKMLIY